MADTVGQRRFGEGRRSAKPSDPGRGIVTVLNFVAAGHARAVAFLIEGSDFITGVVLPVDGGRLVA